MDIDFDKVNLNQVKKIAMGVQYSPVFAIMNNALISPSSCMYFLAIVNELGLVLKSIHNPMRTNVYDYKNYIETFEKSQGRRINIRGQDVTRLNFIIVNIFPMMADNVIKESMDIVHNLQEYQKTVDDKLKTISRID